MNFDVDRTDFRHTRWSTDDPSSELADGQVLLALESFAFTANNISYASAGDFLDYWGFFPTEAPWGRIPVMGIGRIVRSANPELAVGDRYFGFYPMTDLHLVNAHARAGGFVDAGGHRAKHAATYRTFNLVELDPAYSPEREGQYLIARGLFITSFLIDDFLAEHEWFGADTVLITSASSRTSIALAHQLAQRSGIHVVGLTAPRNRSFVESTGCYDEVLAYDAIESLDATIPTVVVDMAGNTDVLSRVHHHFGAQLTYSCRVGATHWDAGGALPDLPGPTPTFFFAPSQIKVRSDEWGRAEFEGRVADALGTFLDHASGWMVIERSDGTEAVEAVYRATLEGTGSAEIGHILSLT
jgi:NADPH:quinone reductase-like Zn-dependent oxidoreductase